MNTFYFTHCFVLHILLYVCRR